MSPEQARGNEVDCRSDQFSFGAVMYELLTGNRPFQRGTTAETLTAIIRENPTPLPPSVPLPVRWSSIVVWKKTSLNDMRARADLYQELRHLHNHIAETQSITTIIKTAVVPKN